MTPMTPMTPVFPMVRIPPRARVCVPRPWVSGVIGVMASLQGFPWRSAPRHAFSRGVILGSKLALSGVMRRHGSRAPIDKIGQPEEDEK